METINTADIKTASMLIIKGGNIIVNQGVWVGKHWVTFHGSRITKAGRVMAEKVHIIKLTSIQGVTTTW